MDENIKQMSTMNAPAGHILCCICGVQVPPNPSNMCANCLKSQVDITEGISKQVTIFYCRGCGRYQKPPWTVAELESREMMALCLKKIKGLDKRVKLVDASFIWTEPHSRRIKVKLTIQKEVFASSIIQQSFVVEFVVANQQCPDCQKSYTEHTWQACVQVRQQVRHKRTFLYLEQQVIKHGATEGMQSVKEMPGGLDFFYLKQGNSSRLVKFLQATAPVKVKDSKKLISQDDHNNSYHYKFTTHVEIAPICKGDLCVLPKKTCSALGGVSALMLCYRVSGSLHMIDPLSLKIVEINTNAYFRAPFLASMTRENLQEYMVLDIELGESGHVFNTHTEMNTKTTMAEVTVAKSSDMGVNDKSYMVMTHLGSLLKVGDLVLGYDMLTSNLDVDHKDLKGRKFELPDVILVNKTYPKKHRAQRRNWRVRNLNIERPERNLKKTEEQRAEAEREMFMQMTEDDPEMQKNMHLYAKKPTKSGPALDEDGVEEEMPMLENLLDDFKFDDDDGPDADAADINFGS